jgi:hypothetical protein
MTTTPNNPEATAAQIKQKMSAGVNPEEAVTETLGTSAEAGGTSGQFQSSAQTGTQAATRTARAASEATQNAADAFTPDDL